MHIRTCGTTSADLAQRGRERGYGYTDATDLLDRYPHAMLAVVDGAGHALMHERPGLLAAFFVDWLDRAHPPDK